MLLTSQPAFERSLFDVRKKSCQIDDVDGRPFALRPFSRLPPRTLPLFKSVNNDVCCVRDSEQAILSLHKRAPMSVLERRAFH